MGTWEWDVVTGAVTWSTTLERIHGIPEGSFAGTFEAHTRDIHPDDRRQVRSAIQASATDGAPHQLEYRIVRGGGEVRWVETCGRRVAGEADLSRRVLGVCTDITDRKQRERERERMVDELRQVRQFRAELGGVIAHDLRNPLAGISTTAQYLARTRDMPAAHVGSLRKVDAGARRMARMIRDLVDLAHCRLGGGIPIEAEPTELGALVRPLMGELGAAHPTRALELVTDGDLAGTWDPDRIAQLVTKLLGNALAHGEDPIHIGLRGEDATVVVSVRNRGEAIPTDAIPHLFEPFRQRRAHRAGLGVGLYVASEIVRAHAGQLEVRSSATDGTTFTVTLPRSPPRLFCPGP